MIKKYSIHFIGGEVMSLELDFDNNEKDLITRIFEDNFQTSVLFKGVLINCKNITHIKEIK